MKNVLGVRTCTYGRPPEYWNRNYPNYVRVWGGVWLLRAMRFKLEVSHVIPGRRKEEEEEEGDDAAAAVVCIIYKL